MGEVSLKGKHLLGLQHATKEEIELILRVAKKMKKSFYLMIRNILC